MRRFIPNLILYAFSLVTLQIGASAVLPSESERLEPVPRPLETLLKDLRDVDPRIRQGAVESMAGRKWSSPLKKQERDALLALVAAINDRDDDVSFHASEAFASIGKTAIPFLADTLKGHKEDLREPAALALTRIGKPAIPTLAEALKDRDASIRAIVAKSLGYLRDDDRAPVQSLLEVLHDKTLAVRCAAVTALVNIHEKDPAALPHLEKTLKDIISSIKGPKDSAAVSVAFARDGKTLASIFENQTKENSQAELWHLATNKKLAHLQCDSGHFDLVAFSPDGKAHLTHLLENQLDFREIASGKVVTSFQNVALAYLSPNARLIAMTNGKEEADAMKIELRSPTTGKSIGTINDLGEIQGPFAFSPDEKAFVFLAYDAKKDLLRANVWDLAKGTLQYSIPLGKKEEPSALALSPDAKILAVACITDDQRKSVVHIWELVSGKIRYSLKGNRSLVIESVAFSPDGKTLASGSGQGWGVPGDVILWNVNTGRQMAAISWFSFWGQSLAFSPDGRRLAIGGAAIGKWGPALAPQDVAGEVKLLNTEDPQNEELPAQRHP